MSSLDHLLESYRADAISERDKGAAFEKLIVETTEAPWSENARAVESAELRAVTATVKDLPSRAKTQARPNWSSTSPLATRTLSKCWRST